MKHATKIALPLQRWRCGTSGVRHIVSSTAQTSQTGDNTSHLFIPLSRRSVIALTGPDAASFVQGLTTNDIKKLQKPNDIQFTCFLTGKGRTLFEAMVSVPAPTTNPLSPSQPQPTLLLDVDVQHLEALKAHIKRFKLRAKFDMVDLSASHGVYSVAPRQPFSMAFDSEPCRRHQAEVLHLIQNICAGFNESLFASAAVDPRNRRAGLRVVLPRAGKLDSLAAPEGSATDYHALRTLLGMPEGLEVADSIPMEWNLGFLNGVSFEKGCYVGQELVARTHFRGLVRKRFVPVYLTGAGSPPRHVSYADPVAAAVNPRTTEAKELRHVHAGGYGHGKGHGPAQTHDFPATQSTGHNAGHSRFGMAEVQRATTGQHIHRVELPFSFLDGAWKGEIKADEAVVAQNAEDKGTKVGRFVGSSPGGNLGFALLRLEHLRHTFPGLTTAAPPTPLAPELDDFSLADTVSDIMQVHERCKSKQVDFIVNGASDDQEYRVVPVLPWYWKHVPFHGAED